MALKDVDLKQHVSTGSYDIEFDLEKLVAALDERSEEVVNIIYKETQDACPVDTGTMKASAKVDKTDKGEFEISYNTDYASYTEFRPGTSCTGWFSNAVARAKDACSRVWCD